MLEAVKAWQGRSMPQGWCDANLDSFCAHRRQRCAGRDEETDSEIHSEGKRCATLANSLTKKAPYKGLGADSEEKREPVSDIDTAVVDSLKVLDLKRPIREADIVVQGLDVRFDSKRASPRSDLPAQMLSAIAAAGVRRIAPKGNIAQVRQSARSGALVGFLRLDHPSGVSWTQERTTDESTAQPGGDET